ncbi:BON domain-containing protein [Mesorhizobium sp. NFR06]|uniref:CBS domain-containing protein n=1 Tax=Mesorhizobium sp. NFR06 TaxID=1566290 RepID=UPI0008E3EF18|nr:CBS domain-containing protein [Mesorhizobium sp. NFR06]SFQ09928.1 BON domain-containing protein [Mesorhizobium sp. NFR06]
MTRKVVTVSLSTPIDEIAALLEVNRARRVLVVNGERLVGIVTRVDLVRALISARESLPRAVSFHDDASIRREIIDALRTELWPSIGEADVTVTNGVVVFWGGYMSEQERKASLVLAEHIAGVRAIDDHRVPLDIAYAMV